jgi:hypothetical protein
VPIARVIYLEPDIDRSPDRGRAPATTVDFDDTAVD